MKVLQIILLLTSSLIFSQNSYYPYLDSNLDVNVRVDDLMSRMTLFEKACQMNQFVGLEHMKKAEKDLADQNSDIDFARIAADLNEQAAILRTIRRTNVGKKLSKDRSKDP